MKRWITCLFCIGFFSLAMSQETAVENLQIAMKLNDKGKYESSLRFCNIALEMNPEMSSAWFMRGFNNYHLNNYDDAIIDFTVALKFDPEYAEAWFYRGKCKQANDDLWGALKDLNKARELDSSKSALLLVKSAFASIFSGSDKQKKKAKGPESTE